MTNTSTRFALLLTCLFSLLSSLRADAQNAWWTWVAGADTANVTPNWGEKGVASASNTPGGRTGMPGWADASGNFWIFGGENPQQGLLGDLWEFNPAANEWTWVSGNPTSGLNPGVYTWQNIPSTVGYPGSRTGHAGWVDKKGNIWIFGGYGYDVRGKANMLNDLWEYNPTTAQWAWVSGADTTVQSGVYGTKGVFAAGNVPGARNQASGWADAAGNIWIFGGQGYDANGNEGPLNDLWEYNTTSNQWAWISGSNVIKSGGYYGIRKIASSLNVPGARYGQSVTVDALGNFWLYGGAVSPNPVIIPQNDTTGLFDDLWEYNPKSGYWTWVAGYNVNNQMGIYITKGVMALAYAPGSRFQAALEVDNNGNFWVWGGYGINGSPGNGGYHELDDLWVYNPTSDAWAWISGSATGQAPTYGQKGVAAAANVPSARQGFAYWIDRLSNLWVFGGGTGAPWTYYDNLWFTPTIGISLALQAVSLQGTSQGQGNELDWQTTNEIKMARFAVERSTDGSNFVDVGSVKAIGNGNNDYTFYDAALSPGVSTFYYRLKMVNEDSTYTWSTTIVVQDNGNAAGLSLYPNPARDASTLEIGANSRLLNTPARLLDAGGRTVRGYLITGQQQQLDLTNLPQGIYFLALSDGTTLSLVKE